MSDAPFDRPEVDALYGLDPAAFVAARDELVKALRADGEKDVAAAVKALKRPSKVAGAINHVARSRPDDIAALLTAGAALRDRQADALSGGDAAAMREATAARREIVRSLTVAVVDLAGPSAREEAAGTFEAASVDVEIGALVSAGRLTTPASRPADMGFLGMPEPGPSPGRSRPTRSASSRRAESTAPAPVRLDRKRIQKLERELTKAERAADEAGDALADAERKLARAQQRLGDAEQEAEAARATRDAASEEAGASQAAADRLRHELEELNDPG